MRWRSGETVAVDGVMVLLLWVNEADCLAREHRRIGTSPNYTGVAGGVTA
jgi:hypothetical protein